MIITMILNIFNKKLSLVSSNENFKNILSSLIIGYVITVKSYNENSNKNLNIEIPTNFPNPFTSKENICFCNHTDKRTNSFRLLISGLEIKTNFYSSELNNFCKTTCLNNNSKLKQNKTINQNGTVLQTDSLIKNNSNLNRKYSTLIYRSNNLKRNFSSFSPLNKVQNIYSNNEINYNKSIFSILSKITELTKDNNYDPRKVQLDIENIWTDIFKEKYQLNAYRTIQDLQPHIYQVFIMNDPTILKRVYPNLYLFLDDVRIFLITYNVITTYFRRSSRTAICGFISDQILFFIYKTYFLPIIQDDNKGKRVVNRKIKEISKKEFTKENIFLSLTKAKRTKLTNLIESPELTKENFINKNKLDLLLSKNKQEMDIKILTEIQFVITKIKIRKLEHESYKSSKKLEITFQDFVS